MGAAARKGEDAKEHKKEFSSRIQRSPAPGEYQKLPAGKNRVLRRMEERNVQGRKGVKKPNSRRRGESSSARNTKRIGKGPTKTNAGLLSREKKRGGRKRQKVCERG